MGYQSIGKTEHTATMAVRALPFACTHRQSAVDLNRAVREIAAKFNITGTVEGQASDKDSPTDLVITFISERKRDFVEHAARHLINWLLYRRDFEAR